MSGKWVGKHFIQTKNKWNFGATTIFELDSGRWTKENIGKLIDEVIPQKSFGPHAAEINMKRKAAIFQKQNTILNYFYGPFSIKHIFDLEIIVRPSIIFTCYDFGYSDNKIFICFTSNIDNLQLSKLDGIGHNDDQYLEKIKFYLNLMENVFNFFQPDFGWTDTLDNMIPFVNKDPREHIFGVNYYDIAMVNKIGRNRILSLSGVITKEFEWGGMIVKLKDNPFYDIGKEIRQEYEKRLFGKIWTATGPADPRRST